MTQQQRVVLQQAVDIIVASERIRFPEKDDAFWVQFRDVLLAICIGRYEDLL